MSENIENKMKDNDKLTKDEATSKEVTKTSENVASSDSKKQLVVTEPKTSEELAALDYVEFDTPAKMLALGNVLCKSQLVPLKKPSDVVAALLTGKELGLPFIVSVSQIYPINNRATLGIHIQKALLLKNGIIFEKIEDAIPIYQFAKTDEEGKTVFKGVQTKEGLKQVPIIVSTGTLEEQPKNTSKREIDRKTTYRFEREIKTPSGKYKEMVVKSSFTLGEAREAELTDKDVWIKYWRRMLDARAFSIGAKEIADDILLGIPPPNEVSDNFYINDDGEEVMIPEVEEQEAVIVEDNIETP